MSVYSRITSQEKLNVQEMRRDGLDYLYTLLDSTGDIDEVDEASWSFTEAMTEYEDRFKVKLQYKIIEKKIKPEVRIAVTQQGYVQGQGLEIARVVKVDRQIVITDTPTKEPTKETLPDWQWPGGREQLSRQETYISQAAQYEYRFGELHKHQIEEIAKQIPQGTVYELGAGAGTLVHFRKDVEAYDLVPRHQLVKYGDMNEKIMTISEGSIVFLQYGYTFLTSAARIRLRKMRAIIIDDIKQPVWLTRVSPTMWSNIIWGYVTPDRIHAPEFSLPFTNHLLALTHYRIYSHNEYVVYLVGMGKKETTEGPYIAGSLKEYVKIVQDIPKAEVYYAPLGKQMLVSIPLVIGTVMHVLSDTIVFLEGVREMVGAGAYIESDTYIISSDQYFEERTPTKCVRWKMQITPKSILMTYDTAIKEGIRVVFRQEKGHTFETNDLETEAKLSDLIQLSGELDKVATLTEDEKILLKHFEYQTKSSLQTLVEKKCLDNKQGKMHLTERGKKTLISIDRKELGSVLVILATDIKDDEYTCPPKKLYGKNLSYVHVEDIKSKNKSTYVLRPIVISFYSIKKVRIKLIKI